MCCCAKICMYASMHVQYFFRKYICKHIMYMRSNTNHMFAYVCMVCTNVYVIDMHIPVERGTIWGDLTNAHPQSKLAVDQARARSPPVHVDVYSISMCLYKIYLHVHMNTSDLEFESFQGYKVSLDIPSCEHQWFLRSTANLHLEANDIQNWQPVTSTFGALTISIIPQPENSTSLWWRTPLWLTYQVQYIYSEMDLYLHHSSYIK